MEKQDIIDGLDVMLGRRGEKITHGDLAFVAAAIMALADSRPGPAHSPTKELAAKLNEMDANRYRWLNKKYDLLLKVGENDDDYTKRHVALKCGPELDRWIDQHIEQEKSAATEEDHG